MSKELEALERERTRLLERIAQIEEEKKIIGDEKPFPTARAKALLDLSSTGTFPQEEIIEVIEALVALRPKPEHDREYFLDWPESEAWQFSVCVPKHEGPLVQINDNYEQVAHTLNAREAERLGRHLLGAAEFVRLLEQEA